MATAGGQASRTEGYLARVQAALRGLPEREVEDILRELRGHIAEIAGREGLEAALRSLGDPVDLAGNYRADSQLVRAECSSSPLVILQGLRHASRSRLGRFAATALYAFAYINVFALWAAALDKFFSPSKTGLWYTPGNLWSLTLVPAGERPAGARELLGWWLVPIAVLFGWALKYLTDRIAQWWIRSYRRTKAAREA
jgi:hypothetical protein